MIGWSMSLVHRRRIVRKLDALEGEQLLRQSSQGLRDLSASNPNGQAVKREADED
jgi:hypothetical protein